MLAQTKKITQKLVLALSLLLAMAFFNFATSPVSAQRFNFREDSGMDITASEAGFATGEKAESVDSIVGMVIYAILGFVGTIFLVLIIYSGVQWMMVQEMGGDNKNKINKAKQTLFNAIIGLFITLGAYVLSYFIISNFT